MENTIFPGKQNKESSTDKANQYYHCVQLFCFSTENAVVPLKKGRQITVDTLQAIELCKVIQQACEADYNSRSRVSFGELGIYVVQPLIF